MAICAGGVEFGIFRRPPGVRLDESVGPSENRRLSMALVTAQMSVSLDGFYSGPEHVDAGFHRVTRWVIAAYAWRQRQGFAGGEQSVDSDLIDEMFQATGAYVMGRRMFDAGEVPWGETPPFRAPVFVVTHRARPPLVRKGGTTFNFVTDGVGSAIAQARAAADGRNVAVAGGGDLLRQVLAAGLLDELELHISPVLLGAGMRLFGALDHDAIELTPTRVIDTPDVTHVRYRVHGPAALTFDDRGAGVEVRS
jgi:dihydrofolate reductase